MYAADVAFALGLMALLLAYGAEKRRSGLWSKMLFGCHVATAFLAIGLLARAPLLVGAALVFHLGIGLPSWFVYVAARRTTRSLDNLAHGPSAELARIVRRPWPARAVMATTGLLMLLLVEEALAHILGRTESSWRMSP